MKIILTILSLMVAAVVQNNAQSVKTDEGSHAAYLDSTDLTTARNMWKNAGAEAQTEYAKNEKAGSTLPALPPSIWLPQRYLMTMSMT